MEAAAAREAEDRFGNHAAGLCHLLERGLNVFDANDRKDRRQRFIRVALQSHVGRTVGRRRIGGTIIRERPTERLGIECAGQLVRGCTRKLDLIDARVWHQ